jgi:subtilase family serine protease
MTGPEHRARPRIREHIIPISRPGSSHMRISRIAIAAGAALTAAGTLTAAVPAAAAPVPAPAVRRACPVVRPGVPRCLTLYAPQVAVNRAIAERAAGRRIPAALTTPKGVGATTIEAAYKLPVTQGAGQTIGIVDAYSTPHLASDLAVYRKQYGLPPCTTASGCLRIVNQQGDPSPLPRPDPTGWGVEETLDVSMVSAACPLCKIIVVEGNQPTFADLAAAEDTAVSLGAAVVSNSYGAREDGFTQAEAKNYVHPGHVIVASTGDYGYTAAQFPANLADVTAVGGTKLVKATNARGWTETVWNDGAGASGSGCSAYVSKPGWQHDTHCPGRTAADVSAVAANVALYDSSLPKGVGPWLTVQGTSASSPLIAGVYGLAGNASAVQPGYEYAHASALFDVTKGNNDWFNRAHGASCGYDYLCVAKTGYDGPTGLGTPDGAGAF